METQKDRDSRTAGRRGASLRAAAAFLLLALVSGPARGMEAPADGKDRPAPESAENQIRNRVSEKTARLRAVLKEIRDGRQRFEADSKAGLRKIEDVRARRTELEFRLAAEKRSASGLEAKCGELERKAAEILKSLDHKESLLARCRAETCDRAEKIRAGIREGVPFEIGDRSAPLAALLDDGPADALDAARIVVRSLEYEISLGCTSSAFQGRIEIGAERPRTRFMRIGLLYMAFVTENGEEAGVLAQVRNGADGGREWAWKADFDYIERFSLKSAIEMAEKRKPPSIVRLPVDLSGVALAGRTGGGR